MSTFAVFLRGINVGGININMAALAQALSELHVSKVKTLLASGNVVLSTELSAEELKNSVETQLRSEFGYDAWVIVVSAAALAEIVAKCPYPADNKTTHSYITLASNAEVLDELAEACQSVAAADYQRLSAEALAWLAPAGGTLESPISKLTAKARYKSSTTTRNLRTLIKVLDATARAQS
ncbi:DUF1697 domain-containing protein [Pseudarthrobacter sp. J1738]|uniref:DUF1697 domain-containing protein n=1 Tax=unclassified Pseudarthrobacter TaxID=2647000 RepID=UPI003D28298E